MNQRTIPVCGRILGRDVVTTRLRLGLLLTEGIEAAFEWGKQWDERWKHLELSKPSYSVGPMQAWHIGHLYFARVASHPHVVKIGFSRRVRERLDDIASKAKVKVEMRPGEIRVGTLADEHWWHKNWEKCRISGEWFFDPRMTDRTLPAFLAQPEQAEAA